MKGFFRKIVDKTFEVGILAKSIFGIFEVLAGIVLAISGKLIVNNLIIALTQKEIADDPSDLFSSFLIKMGNNYLLSGNIFAVFYLIFHGVINICLAIALLKNKIWAYPWAMGGFGIFIIYQLYRFLFTHSVLLMLLTLFDLFIVSIILLEYNSKRKIKI